MHLVHTILALIVTLISAFIPQKEFDFLKTISKNVVDGSAWIINTHSQYSQHDVFPPKTSHQEFDFVIVGASPSGTALANRLSEVEGWNVLVLEAGGVASFMADIPIISVLLYPSVYNWGTLAERQTDLFCTDGRAVYWYI
ncbi:unnamed protein product [Acanthoscelides obtectus]|uniref:Glucose-methanol-choline oxidoreductase N-terminal domain-containing protein n=1 Tax=Acanthoscelides obtectus TaxID=200917 RepID=A0A9P0L583_ACAOB|nr:unnamed protein product [Acanthoscelides obtectus]CAK1679675.1 Oxygen-dependent choline dehydrogenase [Acanthoscelides obtectus]